MTRVLATVGDFVKKGQALIYIHSHELLDARANAAKAQAAVTEREKALAYAKAELDRADRLLAAKAVSKREQAQAAANVTAATAELEQARAELARASEWLEHLTVPHDSHEDIVIYAPISGVVLKRNVTLGTVVNEASDLMSIANLETLWAIAEAPQQQAASARVGQQVEIKVFDLRRPALHWARRLHRRNAQPRNPNRAGALPGPQRARRFEAGDVRDDQHRF